MAMRSRRGCLTCRKRKKKCDEVQPDCGQCLARGVRCGGYETRLTWSNTVATRGYLAGKAVPVREPAHVPSPPGTVTGEPYSSPHTDGMSIDMHVSPGMAPSVGSEHTPPSVNDAGHGPLLEKFFTEGIHRLYAMKANESVVASMRDLAPTSQVLRLVCITLQEAISNGSTVSVLEQTGRTLELFRHQVSAEYHPSREDLFMTGLLLCTLHLIQGLPWTTTFYQFLDFCHVSDLSRLRPNPRYHLGMRSQIENTSVLDMPLFVLGRRSPSRGLWAQFREIQSTWGDQYDDGIEPITGLPRTLLDLLACNPGNSDESWLREDLLWDWSGQIGSELWQCQLWDCYKYAGILAIRHHRCLESSSFRGSLRNTETTAKFTSRAPATGLILFRLLSCLGAVLNEKNWTGPQPLQAQHLALFPLVHASLQVSTLKSMNSPWRDDMQHMRNQVLALDTGPNKHTLILFGILDEAWEFGADGFDADEAARRHEAEITII